MSNFNRDIRATASQRGRIRIGPEENLAMKRMVIGYDTEVSDVEILWSTGEKSRIETPLAANHRYRIIRTR